MLVFFCFFHLFYWFYSWGILTLPPSPYCLIFIFNWWRRGRLINALLELSWLYPSSPNNSQYLEYGFILPKKLNILWKKWEFFVHYFKPHQYWLKIDKIMAIMFRFDISQLLFFKKLSSLRNRLLHQFSTNFNAVWSFLLRIHHPSLLPMAFLRFFPLIAAKSL